MRQPATRAGVDHSSDLCFTSARELAALIRTRKVSAREAMAAHLARIHRVNPTVNAIVAQLDASPEYRAHLAAQWGHALPAFDAEEAESANERIEALLREATLPRRTLIVVMARLFHDRGYEPEDIARMLSNYVPLGVAALEVVQEALRGHRPARLDYPTCWEHLLQEDGL